MTSQLASLVWKEFHERKWMLLAGIAWMVLCVIYAVSYQLVWWTREPVGTFAGVCLLYGLFASVFLAMRTSVGEVTRKTFGFSRALPVSTRRLAWARLLGASSCIVIPIAVGALLLSLALGTGVIEQTQLRSTCGPLSGRETAPWLEAIRLVWSVAAVHCAASVEMLLVLSITGTRCRSESQVGFVGALLALAWMLAVVVVIERFRFQLPAEILFPHTMAIPFSYKSENGVGYSEVSMPDSVGLPLVGNLLLLLGLGSWFAHRYATRPVDSVAGQRWRWWRPRLPAVLSRLSMRWPDRTAALIWLDLRQSVPMAVAGLLLAILFAAVETGIYAHVGTHATDVEVTVGRLGGALHKGALIVGIFWGAVVGAGIFASELRPNLEQFWRSRPISPSAWFWVKYICGLIAVLGVLDLVAVAAGYRYAGFEDEMTRVSISYVACYPLIHACGYSLAVAGICWLRKPAWGAACGVGVLMAQEIVPSLFDGGVEFGTTAVYHALRHDELQGHLNLWQHGYPVVYGATALMTIGAALLARRAIAREDR
ncbi:ABC-2 family transporter protein [Maioricimonas rarisocia]|uniref:ABC-2 family transporter protein n=1 Tax=Maioricimonas rarisocia TaxID=2528026 RepID=A0A517Z1J8_9PLAN|nr:hypothetical protein [Maioricimonas rarisocia]QDU36344.1 ABC-2 family transporter protein [Maioricimonas rarisocia]